MARVRARRLLLAVRRHDARAVADVTGCEDPIGLAVVLAAMVSTPVDVTRRLAWTGGQVGAELRPHLEVALHLAHAVRSWDTWGVSQGLEDAYLPGVCVMLAALADVHASDGELLGWVEQAHKDAMTPPPLTQTQDPQAIPMAR